METFIEAKQFAKDPGYLKRREKALNEFNTEVGEGNIDPPIIELLLGYNSLPYCFTLQSCYGHFIYGKLTGKNLNPLPKDPGLETSVEYRIAYLALCLQDNSLGRSLFWDLGDITQLDPHYIQFGSAEWFWRRCINSYVLQVELERHKHKDKAIISMEEALQVEELRDRVFKELKRILAEHLNK